MFFCFVSLIENLISKHIKVENSIKFFLIYINYYVFLLFVPIGITLSYFFLNFITKQKHFNSSNM